uniref:G-protein coupled receptors family 1 profile domain-containing protein n=1 Tax=Equus asinus TaxID=9793 RepID=A0A9L0J0W5_EQUAS
MGSNQSWVTEFVLVGFELSADVEVLLLWVFSLFYILSLLANGVILGLICLDPSLHTPMYFFLSHLAIIDMSYASSNVPKMLANLVSQNRTISFVPCIIQTFLYVSFGHTECLILVVMSYDRVCMALAVTSWSCGFIQSLVHAILLLRLPFCGPREVNHLFCEILSVLKLACADTSINQVVILADCVFVLVGALYLMLVSYMRILWAILKIQSKEGRTKAFSTCSSHLCVVGLFFGSAIVMYMAPKSHHPEEQQKILSLFYSLFNPMLNPLIYSLKNTEVKGTLRRALCKERPV